MEGVFACLCKQREQGGKEGERVREGGGSVFCLCL